MSKIKNMINSTIVFRFSITTLIFTQVIACISNKKRDLPISESIFTINGEDINMVVIDGGVFMMGCTKEQKGDCDEIEQPAHPDTLSSFLIAKYEVTQKLWKAVMGDDNNPAYNLNCDECPVERVSWDDTQKFLERLNTDRKSVV